MQALRYIVLLLIVAGAFGAGYFVHAISESEESAQPPQQSELEITVVNLREEGPQFSIDVQYPTMALPVDSKIKQIVDSAVSDLKSFARDYPSPIASKYTLTGTFESAYIGPDVVSVRLVMSTYTGGAHGASTIHGVNFDRAGGRELSAADALSMIGLNISEVADQATARLKAKLGTFIFAEGAAPDLKNYQTFLVGADTVTFIFQEYQVAPYAAGPQEVSFPRKADLKQ